MARPPTLPTFTSFIAFASLLMANAGMTKEPVRVNALNARDTSDLESLLRSEVGIILGRENPLPGEPPATSLLRSVRLDKPSNHVFVDLSKAYLPAGIANYSAALEDRLHRMTTGILWTIENELKLSVAGVSFTFDGQPLWFYYPDDFPDYKPNAKPASEATRANTTPIVVSTDHGAHLNSRLGATQPLFTQTALRNAIDSHMAELRAMFPTLQGVATSPEHGEVLLTIFSENTTSEEEARQKETAETLLGVPVRLMFIRARLTRRNRDGGN